MDIKFMPPEKLRKKESWSRVANTLCLPFRELEQVVKQVQAPEFCEAKYTFTVKKKPGIFTIYCSDKRENSKGWFYFRYSEAEKNPVIMIGLAIALADVLPEWDFPVVKKLQKAIEEKKL